MTEALARPRPSLVREALAGLVAGLAASWAMNTFQSRLKEAIGDPDPPRETSTAAAANRLAEASADAPLPKAERASAGTALHYAFGGALGLAYGVAGSVVPDVRAGFGTTYGAAVSLVADEIAVPLFGLSPPPQEVATVNHLRGFVSHLVFGLALEAGRRAIVAALEQQRNEVV